VGITPANVPEASVTESIVADLAAQQATIGELGHERGRALRERVWEGGERAQPLRGRGIAHRRIDIGHGGQITRFELS